MRVETLSHVFNLASKNSRLVFVGSDLGPDVGADFRKEYPERFFMEGISEQHIIGFAAGLAMEGFVPIVNSIGTFLTRRCYEQIVVDLCLQNLPVKLIAYGGGVTYAPLGPTHQAIEDIAIMRVLPNMTVVAPCDTVEAVALLEQCIDCAGPTYFRLSKGGEAPVHANGHEIQLGSSRLLRPSGRVLFVSTGIMAQVGLQVCDLLCGRGVSAGLLHFGTIKPMDVPALVEAATNAQLLVVLEEHLRAGGFRGAIVEALCDAGRAVPPVLAVGIDDKFADQYGTHESLLARFGLTVEQTFCRVVERLKC